MKRLLSMSIVLLIVSYSYGQSNENYLLNDEGRANLLKAHPEILQYEQQLWDEYHNKVRSMYFNKSSFRFFYDRLGTTDSSNYSTVTQNVLYIPVVFHVVHNFGKEDVSDSAIYYLLNSVNKILMNQTMDTATVIPIFKPFIGTPDIQLKLATIDPNGNPTRGITRDVSYLTYNDGNQSEFRNWDHTKYLNITMVNIDEQSAERAFNPPLAIAYPDYDGIILDTYTFDPYTFVYYLGVYLNLSNTFGSINFPYCGDDGIDDTPPTLLHTGTSCSTILYDTTCVRSYYNTVLNGQLNYYKVYPNFPTADTVDYPDTANTQNFMCYNGCPANFTKLQVVMMHTTLNSSVAGRNNLVKKSNLVSAGVFQADSTTLTPFPDLKPVADFVSRFPPLAGSGRAAFCHVHSNITFVNESYNDTLDATTWTFPSNSPTISSSSQFTNVVNQFATPGWATVKLKVHSNTGTDSITKSDMLYIADSASFDPIAAHYYEDFNPNGTRFVQYPIFDYFKSGYSWKFINYTGAYDNYCYRFSNYDKRNTFPEVYYNTPNGAYGEFYTPAFDLSAYPVGNLNLNFYSAGAWRTSNPNLMKDSLIIEYSVNGYNWSNLTKITGIALGNNGLHNEEYIPASILDWKLNSINVPVNIRVNTVYFRFRYDCHADSSLYGFGTGNNYYLDRLHFSTNPLGTSEIQIAENEMMLVPNPTSESTTLAFNTNEKMVTVSITDVTGRTLYKELLSTIKGMNYLPITTKAIANPGIYMVTIQAPGSIFTKKLVRY